MNDIMNFKIISTCLLVLFSSTFLRAKDVKERDPSLVSFSKVSNLNNSHLFNETPVEIGTSNSGGRLKLVDFNKDGWLDIIEGSGWITLSDGNGTFLDPIKLAYSGGALEVGDFDNDGFVDIFFGRWLKNDIVLFGDENYSFKRTMEVLSKGKDKAAFAFDYDKDGDLDLYLAHNHATPGKLLTNKGDGNFTITSSHGSIGWQVYGSDLNSDGQVELVSVGHSRAWTVNYDGSLSAMPGASFYSLGSFLPTPTELISVFGDIDGDGDTDVVISEEGSRGCAAFLNTDGKGNFVLGSKFALGMAPSLQHDGRPPNQLIDLGDLDNDGDLDVCFVANGKAYFFMNDGGANFDLLDYVVPLQSSDRFQLGDMDNDGDLDLVFNGGARPRYFLRNLIDQISNRPTPPPAPGTGGLSPPDPDYKDTIAELKRLLAEKEKKLAHCETEMAAKEKQIGDLTSTNAKLQGDVKSLNGKVTALETEVAALKTDNEGLKEQIQHLREDNQNISNELTVANNHLEEAIRVAETPFINGWVYDPVRGWLFTDAEHFPLVYTHKTDTWHYYELGSSEPRYFYNYTSQEWVAWDAIPVKTNQVVANR